MKARVDDSVGFKPITISITFETEGELGQFHAIHNHSSIVNATKSIDHSKIRELLNPNNQIDHITWNHKLNAALESK